MRIFEIDPEKFTYGFALNYGFHKAKGEYVVCLSAHALPVSRNWLKTLISEFNDEEVAAVMCKTIPWPDCNPFDRRGLLRRYNIQKKEITEGLAIIFSNSSSAIRRNVWQKIHFDETLTGAEDYDWIKKAIELKYKVLCELRAEVYHSHNESLKQIYRRQHRETFAFKVLKCNKYSSLSYILFDLIAGTIYDMVYVLYKRDSLKWFFFAPLRKLAINYGRFRTIIRKSAR
ncbi:MAG: glycosyltransferase family 2 protein [Candidatus Mariimomonas ferrooxydans]